MKKDLPLEHTAGIQEKEIVKRRMTGGREKGVNGEWLHQSPACAQSVFWFHCRRTSHEGVFMIPSFGSRS
jgi:hypothetical protein